MLTCFFNNFIFCQGGTKRRDWVLACLTDKEYCQAKKVGF